MQNTIQCPTCLLKSHVTGFVRTFFGSDWLEKPLECLLQWVTVKEENTRSITASTSPDLTSPGLTPALEPIAGHMLSQLIEMHEFERCEALVKQALIKLTGDALYQLLAFCYR